METEQDIRISYRLHSRDKIKTVSPPPVAVKKKNSTAFNDRERYGYRKVLRLSTVDAVDVTQTPILHYENTQTRSVSAMDRRIPGLSYLPYLLGSRGNERLIDSSVINPSYKGFRTQEERNTMAFYRMLQREMVEQVKDDSKGKLSTIGVINISRPAQLHLRYAIQQKSSRSST